MKVIQYQGYTIRSYPRRLPKRDGPKRDGWTIKISISWQTDGLTKVKEYSADSPFPSEAEADIHGITFGQRIIDNKIPGLSPM
jgi:hypothetical protein